MTTKQYSFGTTVRGSSFDAVVKKVTDALKQEGFGILTEIDVQATLKKKLDADFRRYLILGACNPPLAKRALEAEPDIGLLLPCNVVVQEGQGTDIAVSIGDPRAMFSLVENVAVAPLAEEVEQRLRRVVTAVAAKEN